MNEWREPAAWVAVIAFNVPIVVTAIAAAFKIAGGADLSGMLKEKSDTGAAGDTSYSRVTGLVGVVIVGSLFWVMSNVVIATSLLDPASVSSIVADSAKLFLVGAALFVPYAFNQIKSVLQ
jgi:hypothetical protein